jgi:hypothetical protein
VKKTIATALATAAALLGVGVAHADPPAPVQCKQVNAMNVCRQPDGSVTTCSGFTGCQPVYVALPPGFWDTP